MRLNNLQINASIIFVLAVIFGFQEIPKMLITWAVIYTIGAIYFKIFDWFYGPETPVNEILSGMRARKDHEPELEWDKEQSQLVVKRRSDN